MSRARVLKSTAVVSALTGVSRLLGFLREILMAYFFGTSLPKSAFDIAFRIPNLFRRLFGEGALSAAFVPVFTTCISTEGKPEARRLAGRVFVLLMGGLTCVAGAGGLITLLVMQQMDLSSRPAAVLPLLAIMLPYMIFICLVALCMGILNSVRHFAVPAVTPVILNLAWIVSLFVLCPLFGESPGQRIYGVAWGIFIAGIVQLAVQFPVLRRFDVLPDFTVRSWRSPRVLGMLALMGPAALGMGLHQVNVVIDGVLAMWVADWAPAALTYAERLIYLPLGLFATALGTVLLPTFSQQAAMNDTGELRRSFHTSMSGLMLIMVPAAVGISVLARPIVELAFMWKNGEFDTTSAIVTTRALLCYAPGLVVFSMYKVIVPAFYALQDTRTPVRIGVYAVLMNFFLNVIFVITWPDGYQHAGLATATVLASLMNSAWLGALLSKRIGGLRWRETASVTLRAVLAAIAMGGTAWLICNRLSQALVAFGKWGELGAVGAAIGAGALIYAIVILCLCRREFAALRAVLRGTK